MGENRPYHFAIYIASDSNYDLKLFLVTPGFCKNFDHLDTKLLIILFYSCEQSHQSCVTSYDHGTST